MDRSEAEISADIKQNAIEFIEDLRSNAFEDDQKAQGDLLKVEIFFKLMTDEQIAAHIVEKVLPFAKQIEARKVNFFYKRRNEIFGGIGDQSKIDYYASKFTLPEKKGGLKKDDVEVSFKYFDTFIALAQHKKKDK